MRRRWSEKVRSAGWRTWVAAGTAVLIVIAARPTWGSFWWGLPLVLIGEAIRLWAAGYLVKTTHLVVDGPYAYVQHPLYLGSLLAMAGLITMGSYPWWILAVALLLYFAYYLPRKHRIEKNRLSGIYGDAYRAYEAAVPLLVPYRGAYRQTGASPGTWRWERLSANSEDGTFYVLAVAVLILAIKAHWS